MRGAAAILASLAVLAACLFATISAPPDGAGKRAHAHFSP